MRIGHLPKWPMSAYSDSVPVKASSTAPSTTNEAQRVAGEEAVGVARVERREHRRVEPDVPQRRPRRAPTNHSRHTGPNSAPTLAVPRRCSANRPSSTTHRDRQHPALEERRADLQALDRRDHRDRRREHRLAEEQRRAEQAEQHHARAQARPVLQRVGWRARAAPWCRPRRGCRRASPAPRT